MAEVLNRSVRNDVKLAIQENSMASEFRGKPLNQRQLETKVAIDALSGPEIYPLPIDSRFHGLRVVILTEEQARCLLTGISMLALL